MRLPRYFPRGTFITGGRPLSERATRWPASSRSPGLRGGPEHRPGIVSNVGLAIVGGLVKPNLSRHGFRGTSIDYRSHQPGHSAGRALPVPVGLYLVLSATAQSLRRRLSSCCHFSLSVISPRLS